MKEKVSDFPSKKKSGLFASWSVAVILVLVLALPVWAGAASEKDSAGRLQGWLDELVASPEANIPGAALYVETPTFGPWIGVAGLGNLESKAAMRPDDRFRAGSAMKPFVAVVTLQLVEEGLFSLDDPLPALAPDATAAKFADSDKITVRMLLNHTSGIGEWLTQAMYGEIAANPKRVWKVEEFLDVAAKEGPVFAPGQGWAYNNTEYLLLGLVIEQATGSSWREEVRQRIIEPLKLENTLLPEPGDPSMPGDHAHGYLFIEGKMADFTEVDPSMAGACGGHALITTTTDLARFIQAVLAGELFKNDQTLNEMLTFVDVELVEGGYGLGLMKFIIPGDIEVIGHTGGTAGFHVEAFQVPSRGITFALGVNTMVPSMAPVFLPALKLLLPGTSP